MTRRLLPVLVAGLVLAACGSGSDDAGEPAPSTTSSAAVTSGTASPDTASPDTASPGTASSDAASPDTASSDAGSTPPVDATPAPGPTAPAAATPATSEPTGEGSAVVPAEAPEALQFAAPLIGGGDIELTTLAGRPVLLWFWAPW